MPDYERHPLSQLWGDILEDQFAEMLAAFLERPTRQMITLFEGQIVDGWHRYKMCLEAGLEPFFSNLPEGQDPVAFAITRNAYRRHLTPGQRAACVVACHEWRERGIQPGQGRDETGKFTAPETVSGAVPPPPTQREIAEQAGVSDRTIRDAQVAQEAGFGEAVRSGEMSPHAAAQQARQEPDAPPAAKPPTPKERLEAERDALAMEIHEKAQRIEDLERAVRETRAQQSDYPHEREAVANEREAVISALRSSVDEWQTKCQDERRRANFWERQAKALGWRPKDKPKPPEFPVHDGWDGQEHGEF